MIRYRSASTVPGVKPPRSMESEEARRPTRDGVGARRAAAATDGDAMFVGSSDTDETASPHDGQNRDASGSSEAQKGQWGTVAVSLFGLRRLPFRERVVGLAVLGR